MDDGVANGSLEMGQLDSRAAPYGVEVHEGHDSVEDLHHEEVLEIEPGKPLAAIQSAKPRPEQSEADDEEEEEEDVATEEEPDLEEAVKPFLHAPPKKPEPKFVVPPKPKPVAAPKPKVAGGFTASTPIASDADLDEVAKKFKPEELAPFYNIAAEEKVKPIEDLKPNKAKDKGKQIESEEEEEEEEPSIVPAALENRSVEISEQEDEESEPIEDEEEEEEVEPTQEEAAEPIQEDEEQEEEEEDVPQSLPEISQEEPNAAPPPLPPPAARPPIRMTDDEIRRRVEAESRVEILKCMGYRPKKPFDDSTPTTLIEEWADKIEKTQDAKQGLENSRQVLLTLVKGLEKTAKLQNFFPLNLDNWSHDVQAKMQTLDLPLLRCWMQLRGDPGKRMNPFIELAIALGFSGANYHMTRTMAIERARELRANKTRVGGIYGGGDEDEDEDVRLLDSIYESMSSESNAEESMTSLTDDDFETKRRKRTLRKRRQRQYEHMHAHRAQWLAATNNSYYPTSPYGMFPFPYSPAVVQPQPQPQPKATVPSGPKETIDRLIKNSMNSEDEPKRQKSKKKSSSAVEKKEKKRRRRRSSREVE